MANGPSATKGEGVSGEVKASVLHGVKELKIVCSSITHPIQENN
jgi:hypothetical protein